MTEAGLELAILRRYVEHHDSVGGDAPKCDRELDMREVISGVTGTPPDDETVKRFHARLAPPAPPYSPGVLRPCSDSRVNQVRHRYHARAFFEPGNAPAWERISELESQLPESSRTDREMEQKFGILNSIKQAEPDFSLYSSKPGTDSNVGVLFLDIDDFKSLNVRFTESVVDREILAPFQELLRDSCIHRGEAYRHGGEEFLLFLPNQTHEEIERFAERLRNRVEAHDFTVCNDSVGITVSIGVAIWPIHGDSREELVGKANIAEQEAKNDGKNRVRFAK